MVSGFHNQSAVTNQIISNKMIYKLKKEWKLWKLNHHIFRFYPTSAIHQQRDNIENSIITKISCREGKEFLMYHKLWLKSTDVVWMNLVCSTTEFRVLWTQINYRSRLEFISFKMRASVLTNWSNIFDLI